MTGSLQRRDHHYMELAFKVAEASKCLRAHYGTVIVSADGRIVATGRNGHPRGSINDHVCTRVGLPPNSPKASCCLHSEANAIVFSDPLERLGGTMYVSGVPCNDCALMIMQSGVRRLVYYDGATDSGHVGSSTDALWEAYGCEVERCPFTWSTWDAEFAPLHRQEIGEGRENLP